MFLKAVKTSGMQFTAIMAFLISMGSTSQAIAPQQNDKLDVSDLEKKYWAAKDSDFNVVQNRIFTKAGRFALSAIYGNTINEPWFDGPTFGGSLNYYFSERYGVEVAYTNTDPKDSQTKQRLNSQFGAPNYNKVKQYYGIGMNWVPFYAKMSVLNSNIIYFDMAISPGFGQVTYEQQMEEGGQTKTAPAFSLDVTQSFFLNNHLALRVDYKNRWNQEQVVSYRPANRVTYDETKNTTLLMFGLTLFY